MAEASHRDAIAVVGMAGRFPGARGVEEFWRNLLDGVMSITSLDDDALRAAGIPERDIQDPNYVKAAPLLDDVDLLDAGFFGISPREAEVLDPQHRVMLEVSHAALQHSGHEPSGFDGRIGMYAGSRHNAYLHDNVEANAGVLRAVGHMVTLIANDLDYLATGVAYRLNLRGPAITSVTACSTSLVAAHQACRGLLGGECDLAVAGGVEIAFPVGRGYRYSEGGVNSPDGRVRPFDANARGTVFGSGCGAVVLKRLSDALADNDTIHAVILGSALNNDGSDKAAFAAPSEEGQVAVIEAALREARVDPDTISYVEAHGTGTMIGDPLEVRALTRAYRRHTDRVGYCAISSVKGNVGHLGAAAGVTGLIKAAHCVREGVLPPGVNLEEPNPAIDFASSPFYPNTTVVPWQDSRPRRAGVSSYGIGGTNVHMVIEQPPQRPVAPPSRRPYQLITLSARTPTALDAATKQLAEHMDGAEESLADAAYTLNLGRPALPVRRVAIARDRAQAVDVLSGSGSDSAGAMAQLPTGTVPAGVERTVGFLFPGQGAQHVQMGRGLYESEPSYRAKIDWCAEVLADSHGLDLRELLFPEQVDEAAAQRLNQTAVAQPALFAVEHALVELLREWGVEPGVLAGHSVGEYVAACAAGVLRPEDALRLLAARGALMQELPEGSMLAVMLPEEHLLQMLPPELDLAAVNAPGVCAVSGEDRAIRELMDDLGVQGVGSRLLHTSHAFHSRMMDPILDAFRERVAAVELSPPRIPYMSNLTGTLITAEQATDPDYWVRHLRSCVRFSDSLSELIGQGGNVLTEVGPGRTLSTLVGAHPAPSGSQGRPSAVTTLRGADERGDDLQTALTALGRIWTSGVQVDWKRFWASERRGRIPIPGYPYERVRYWIDPDETQGTAGAVPEDTGPHYVPVWRESGPLTADTAVANAEDTQWVVFARPGEARLGDLVRRLTEAGARLCLVEPGDDYHAQDGKTFTVRVSEPEDYARMLQEIAKGDPQRLRLVHAWSVGSAPSGAGDVERCQHWLDYGFHSCLTTLQAAARTFHSVPVDLCILSSDMQDVSGQGDVEPAKAATLGLVTTAPKEFEDLTCHSVDLGASGPSEMVGAQLFAELTAGPVEGQVAYRGRKRWTWAFSGVELQPREGAPRLLKERGVYVITGGLGGLGMELGRQLAEEVHARLVLTGRGGLPDRAEWPALVERGASDDATVRRIRGVMALEEAGAEVLVCAGDVADEAQMKEIRAEVESVFGAVDGVFHLAGVAGGGMLETRSHEDASAVLTPKVAGTYVVDNVFSPELFVLYSTIAAPCGDFGLGDYNGANAAMDAYAQSHWASSRHIVSINWPVWTEVGMGVDNNSPAIFGQLSRGRIESAVAHPLLAGRHQDAEDTASFEVDLSHDRWVLAEHKLSGTPTMPGTGLVELVRAAYQELTGESRAELRELRFGRPLMASSGVTARVDLQRRPDGGYDVSIVGGGPGEAPQEYTRGQVHPAGDATPAEHDLKELRDECSEEVSVTPASVSSASPDSLVKFGPRWDNIAALHSGADRDLADLSLPEQYLRDSQEFVLHPALLDCAVALVQSHRLSASYLPIGYDRVVVHSAMPANCHSVIRYLDDGQGDVTRVDMSLLDENGTELVKVEGFSMLRVDETTGASSAAGSAGSEGSAGSVAAPTSEVNSGLLRGGEMEGGISNTEGAETLRLVLGSRVRPQVMCAPEGLAERFRRVNRVTRATLLEQLSSVARAGAGTRSLATPYVEPESGIEKAIAGLWRDALGIDKVGAEDEFLDLGGDSLVAVQLADRLTRRFRVDISVATLFENRTVRNIAGVVEEALLARVSSLTEEEAMEELSAFEQPGD